MIDFSGLFRRRPEPPAPPQPKLLSYRVGNLQGLGTRERQEDSFAFANAMDVTEIRRRGLLAVVADGMGGMEDGKRVSEGAVAEILAWFSGMDREDSIPGQLQRCVLEASDRLYNNFRGAGGTTLVVSLFFRECLYWACVGDSFLYLKRGRGLYRLNQEHNYRTQLYREAVRAGRLDAADANADPDGHRLSQFLGKDSLDEIDMNLRPLLLQNGDRILLCSDGIGGVLDPNAVSACLETETPAQACSMMDKRIRALGRRSQDNYTALVVMCGY